MKRPSFQTHLALVASTISGAILLIFGIASWIVMKDQFSKSVDLRIGEPIRRTIPLVRNPARWHDSIYGNTSDLFDQDTDFPKLLFVRSRDGRLLFLAEEAHFLNSPSIQESGLLHFEEISPSRPPPDWDPRKPERPPPPHHYKSLDVEDSEPGKQDRQVGQPQPGNREGEMVYANVINQKGDQWRVAITHRPFGSILSGAPVAFFERELRQMQFYLFAFIPLGLIAIALSGWLIARRALRPIRRISESTASITAKDLCARISTTDNDYREFDELTTVLNTMMDRLDKSFQQATRFTADASHELKTPLAIMQADIQDALKQSKEGSQEQKIFSGLSSEIHRLKHILQSLLLLAQADAGKLTLSLESFDLSRECEALLEDSSVLCEEKSIELHSDLEGNLTVRADKILLLQAIQNLLSNAIKYNHKNGKIWFKLETIATGFRTTVRNTGNVIPIASRELIFERFYRMDPARNQKIDGFGLGLNLAREIVKAHRGSLTITDNAETQFELCIPTS